MDYKKVLIGAGVVFVSYKIGIIVGSIKTLKMFMDNMEEDFPGIKEQTCKNVSDKVITRIFNKASETEEES